LNTFNSKISANNTKQPETSLRYFGSSMKPTFRDADVLNISVCNCDNLHLGDVIVFNHPERQIKIAHRVRKIDKNRIYTGGDNSKSKDDYIITDNILIGKVTSLKRSGKTIKVRGGLKDHFKSELYHRYLIFKRKLMLFILVYFRNLYRALAEHGIVKRLIPLHKFVKICAFRNNDSVEHKMLLGSMQIGKYVEQYNRWHIRPPFRLVIAEDILPVPETISSLEAKSSFVISK